VLPLPFWNYVVECSYSEEAPKSEAPKSKMAPEEPYNSSGAASPHYSFLFT